MENKKDEEIVSDEKYVDYFTGAFSNLRHREPPTGGPSFKNQIIAKHWYNCVKIILK